MKLRLAGLALVAAAFTTPICLASPQGWHVNDVAPRLTTHSLIDRVVVESHGRGEAAHAFARRRSPAKVPYHFVGQDGHVLPLAANLGGGNGNHPRLRLLPAAFARNSAPLGDHVAHIVLRRPEKEMGRVNAWPVVASVQNVEAGRNRSIVDNPRRPMGSVPERGLHLPISALSQGATPFPALLGVGLGDITPESFGKILTRSAHAHIVIVAAPESN